jgi:hypothetical protein
MQQYHHLRYVVRTVNVEFQHVILDTFVESLHCFGKSAAKVSEPNHVFFLEISHAPDVSPFYQSQQMKATDRRAIPVEIRQQEEVIFGLGFFRSIQHIFLLLPAFENVEDPVQFSFLAVLLHVGSDIVGVYRWRLEHYARLLERVLPDVAVLTRVDQVDLEVWWCWLVESAIRFAVGHVPVVDIIGAEVVDMCDQTRERRQVRFIVAESCSLGEQEGWLATDCSL